MNSSYSSVAVLLYGDVPIVFFYVPITFQEEYDRIRPISYPNIDVFFLCFSVENRDSFQNLKALGPVSISEKTSFRKIS